MQNFKLSICTYVLGGYLFSHILFFWIELAQNVPLHVKNIVENEKIGLHLEVSIRFSNFSWFESRMQPSYFRNRARGCIWYWHGSFTPVMTLTSSKDSRNDGVVSTNRSRRQQLMRMIRRAPIRKTVMSWSGSLCSNWPLTSSDRRLQRAPRTVHHLPRRCASSWDQVPRSRSIPSGMVDGEGHLCS